MKKKNTKQSFNTKTTTITPQSPSPSSSSSSSHTMSLATWLTEYRNLSIRAATLEKDCIAKIETIRSSNDRRGTTTTTTTRKISMSSMGGISRRSVCRQEPLSHDTANDQRTATRTTVKGSGGTTSSSSSSTGYFLSPEQYIKRLERLRQICSEAVCAMTILDKNRHPNTNTNHRTTSTTTTNHDDTTTKTTTMGGGGKIAGFIQQAKRQCKRSVEAYENEYESLMEIVRSEEMRTDGQRKSLERSLRSIIGNIEDSTGRELVTSPQCGHD